MTIQASGKEGQPRVLQSSTWTVPCPPKARDKIPALTMMPNSTKATDAE